MGDRDAGGANETPTDIGESNAYTAFDQRKESNYDGEAHCRAAHLMNVIHTCQERQWRGWGYAEQIEAIIAFNRIWDRLAG